MADGTELETTERSAGCGQATRQRRIEEKWGRGHEIEVTVDGWKVRLFIDAVTTMPLAVKVVKIQEYEALGTRALVMQAHAQLAGAARLPKVVLDKAFVAGTDLWWRDQRGIRMVVPAKDHMGVTAEARALAVAGDGMTVRRRVHTVRHGQGQGAWTERLETAAVGSPGLMTSDQ
jgi:hypothetical protein